MTFNSYKVLLQICVALEMLGREGSRLPTADLSWRELFGFGLPRHSLHSISCQCFESAMPKTKVTSQPSFAWGCLTGMDERPVRPTQRLIPTMYRSCMITPPFLAKNVWCLGMGFRQFSCIVRGDARRDCLIHRIAILGISWLRHRSLISSAKTLQNSFKNEEIRRKVRKMDTNPKIYIDRNPRGKMRPGNITVQSWSAAAFVRPLSSPLPGVVCATKATLLLREGRALHGWRLKSQKWTHWLKSSLGIFLPTVTFG